MPPPSADVRKGPCFRSPLGRSPTGSTVLAVCAVASKYSDDPRVLLEGTNTRLSSGWKYFCQLEPL
ncbi:hypothetical protein B0H17DRAFT_1099789, partial [Mycena rosella]